MKKLLVCCAIIVLLLLGWFVWPTRYKHSLYGGKLPMREDRFTGKVEVLYLHSGWKEVREPTILEDLEKAMK